MFPEYSKFQLKTLIWLCVLCLGLEWLLGRFKVAERFSLVTNDPVDVALPPKGEATLPEVPVARPEKVVIGLVSCQQRSASTPEKFFQGMTINEEAVVTMKSILISARLYQIPQVEFHLFVEKDRDPAWFHRQLGRNMGVAEAGVDVSIYFHSAVEAVPDRYKKHMVYHIPYRCGFVRMFFPTALPEVDSIIYFDTDMLITGNVGELWQRLGKMEGEQVIGVARNNEPENHYVDHLPGFGDILPLHKEAPKGLNSGLLVMNLTRMRQHRWQERFLRLWEDYYKIYDNLEDQRTLNLFAYLDPGQLHLVPCQFDLMHTNCDHGWICQPALQDPYGVQVVHGAGNQFEGEGRFKRLFQAYRQFTWGTGSNHTGDPQSLQQIFLERVAAPVRKSYEAPPQRSKTESQCYGTLNRLLFKNFELHLQNS